ncbi:hypothetical protein [Pseudoramibacter faecis]|uniref:hypothetical protein n=1 Tax=Pseudoramibacter faecis TaxID=3108534 RepID=UPI002E767351|nr:hypothetical protein [Pseudoramibacter sp. HA2172]
MDKMYGSAVSVQGAASTIAQKAVIPAFEDDSFIQSYLQKYDRRRRYEYKLFNQISGTSVRMPEAGFYFWINAKRLEESSEIVNYLV